MSARYETYREIIMEIIYTEEGEYLASCKDPMEDGVLESPVCSSPREAFDLLRAMLDRIYYEFK